MRRSHLSFVLFLYYHQDIFNGLMALPNLVAILALSGVIVKETKSYFDRLEKGELK
ncbi:MAG: alanine:cation symporter family protein [Bacillota bacterium]|nr:alanine:cation symporter family protein [Bacillota bacterium]